MKLDKLPEGTSVVYDYCSSNWSQELFEKSGAITAVLLNYNKKNNIISATKSVLEQDYLCYEILLMDDCSTDGSPDVMLDTVKEFVKACEGKKSERSFRIRVIRNSHNQSILGQWSIAVSTSNGKWFGMFCADDVAHRTRLKEAAALIAEYPTAFGICTSAITSKDERMGGAPGRYIWRGSDARRPRSYWLGCTSFWRRDLLEKCFGKHNEDDYVLHWLAIILSEGCSDVSLVWALDRVTINYSVGTGVSTELQNHVEAGANWISRTWRAALAIRARGRRFGIHTWKVIKALDAAYGKDSCIRAQVKGFYRLSEIDSGNWYQRVFALYNILVTDRKCDYGGMREEICQAAAKNVLMFILGPVSYVVCMIPGLVKRRLIKHG